MLETELRNWTVNDYETDQWTDLVNAPAVVRTVIIANSSDGSASVSARISNGRGANAEERAVILPPTFIDSGESRVFDLCQLNLGRNDALQFRFSVTDVAATASGEAPTDAT